MNDVVELILKTYQSMCPLDTERAADSRQKISRYIETLASAGQRDAEQLTIYGLAHLTELHEGQDPRFTGCYSGPRVASLHAGRPVRLTEEQSALDGSAASAFPLTS
jgi:hypothetical protein